MRKILMFIVTLALAATLNAAVVGWNNDGSGDYGRDCKPPLNFDGEKGTNIQWKAPLPNWSNSSPIVIEPADGKGPVRVVCVALLRCRHRQRIMAARTGCSRRHAEGTTE